MKKIQKKNKKMSSASIERSIITKESEQNEIIHYMKHE